MGREIIRCPTCGKVISYKAWITPPIAINEEEVEGKYWCSVCQKEFIFRHKIKIEGRSYTSDGYVLLKVPGRGWMREHLFIWEKHNQIVLPKGFVIHHINGVKDDNHIENLIALPKRSHNSYLVQNGTYMNKNP